jgi:hypothetical protein
MNGLSLCGHQIKLIKALYNISVRNFQNHINPLVPTSKDLAEAEMCTKFLFSFCYI